MLFSTSARALKKVQQNEYLNGGKNKISFQDSLDMVGFTIFQTVSDLGYFQRRAHMSSPIEEEEANDLKAKIVLSSLPEKFVPPNDQVNSILPIPFQQQVHEKKEKHLENDNDLIMSLAPMYVAINHRNVLPENLDFCFDSSTLYMLATMSIDPNVDYLVYKIRETIVVTRQPPSDCNNEQKHKHDLLRRLATGRMPTSSDDNHDHDDFHLHVTRVGKHKVLFSTPTTVVDRNDCPVTLKLSNLKYWSTETMFEMMSSKSQWLLQGRTSLTHLLNLQIKSFGEIAAVARIGQNLHLLEDNILNGMRVLKRAKVLDSGDAFSIGFRGKELTLQQRLGDRAPRQELLA